MVTATNLLKKRRDGGPGRRNGLKILSHRVTIIVSHSNTRILLPAGGSLILHIPYTVCPGLHSPPLSFHSTYGRCRCPTAHPPRLCSNSFSGSTYSTSSVTCFGYSTPRAQRHNIRTPESCSLLDALVLPIKDHEPTSETIRCDQHSQLAELRTVSSANG